MASGDDSDALAETVPTGSAPAAAPAGARRLGAGELVAGRYDVVRFVAAGAMGEVYEAKDRLLGATIALKAMREGVARDPQIVERFKREIQLSRKVTHANVCRVFDVGVHEGAVFLTMELLPGETLAERLRRAGPMSVEQARPLALQMIAALSAAHEAGIVHRDFKPQNVMLAEGAGGEGTRAVVSDFGVARCVHDEPGSAYLTGAGDVIGTPAYMAPEQVNGSTVGPACDVYALGLVLYEMLTGRLPFEGSTPLALASARLTTDPSRPSTHAPGLDPAFDETVLRCLARDPARRPALASLPGLLAGAAPRAGARPWLGWAAAAAVIGALAAGIAWWQLRPQPRSTPATPAAPPELPAPSPRAATVDEIGSAEARVHFTRAQAAYDAGRLDEAQREFERAFALFPAPAILYNLGVMHEKQQDYGHAVLLYRRYLNTNPPAADRAQVERRIERLERLAPVSAP